MSRFVTLAGRQVAELADRAAEGGRLSRGRALFRKGSVSDLSVIEGSVTALVRGSQGDTYETTVSTTPAPPGVVRQVIRATDSADGPANDSADGPADGWSIDRLLDDGIALCPRDIDLAFDCNCADWDEPCKHVVAVLLAFADRVDLDAAELLRWRGIDLSAPIEQGDSPTGRTGWKASVHRPVAESTDRTARLSELEALLGDTVLRVNPADDPTAESAAEPIDKALAEFLGVGRTIEAVDMSDSNEPDPLFATFQLGPLADLGPELGEALEIIKARLNDESPPA